MITITNILCLMILGISFLAFRDQSIMHKLLHLPYEENRKREYYRWLSSGFIHRDTTHLFINLIVLWSFGNHVERIYKSIFSDVWATLLYAGLFLIAVLAANIPSFLKNKDNPGYAALGASGGVSGILFVSILFAPWNPVYLMAILPIPGIIFGLLYLGYEYYASKKIQDSIGHDAHFWGAIAGILYTIIIYADALPLFLHRLSSEFPF